MKNRNIRQIRTLLIFAAIFSLLVMVVPNILAQSEPTETEEPISFLRRSLDITSARYTQVIIHDETRLYASTLFGEIYVWDIQNDGTLANEHLIASLPDSVVIGLVFDPTAPPDAPVLWFTQNSGMDSETPGPIFSGKINQLVAHNYGEPDETWEVVPAIEGLPRSHIDHLINGMVFGPDGAIYIAMGSVNSMGDRDPVWGMRPETLLSGAVLRLDTEKLLALDELPLNVATGIPEEDGYTLLDENNYGYGAPELADLYDPLAPDAPLTLYATGMRNPYDIIWHSNGHLYLPVNGATTGGRVPGTPDEQPESCNYRSDIELYGDYVMPEVEAQRDLVAQTDYLAHIFEGGYYGHPNPTRCEWVAYGGNPTESDDPGQQGDHYPVGTLPDRNWRGQAYDMGMHASANGTIEYKNDAFDGRLQGKLMIVRYSVGRDIVVLEPDEDTGEIIGAQMGIPGFTNLKYPLDLIEDPRTGNIYLAEFGLDTITLLVPAENVTPMQQFLQSMSALFNSISRDLVLGVTLTGIAGVISLGTAWYLLVRFRRNRYNVFLMWHYRFQTIIPVVIVLALLVFAFRPLRSGVRDLRAQRVSSTVIDLGSETPDETVAQGEPIKNTYDEELIAKGSEIYATTCAACHGAEALGELGIGPKLVDNVYVMYHEDAEVIELIRDGREPWDEGNTTGMSMPAMGGNASLTEDDLPSLVAYLRSLSNGVESADG